MDYFDNNGVYSQSKVIDGIAEIDKEIQDMMVQEAIDQSRLTRLRYEQMLRGLYLFDNPYK